MLQNSAKRLQCATSGGQVVVEEWEGSRRFEQVGDGPATTCSASLPRQLATTFFSCKPYADLKASSFIQKQHNFHGRVKT